MLTGACTTITLVPLVMHKRRTTLDTAVLPLAAIRSKHVTRSPPSWSRLADRGQARFCQRPHRTSRTDKSPQVLGTTPPPRDAKELRASNIHRQ